MGTLNPADLELLRVGDQRRFNREGRVLAWALGILGPIIALAVNQGIAAAFDGKVDSKPISWKRIVRSMPHYEPEPGEQDDD